MTLSPRPRRTLRLVLGGVVLALGGCVAANPGVPKTFDRPAPDVRERLEAEEAAAGLVGCAGSPAADVERAVYRRAYLAEGAPDSVTVRCAELLTAGTVGTATAEDREAVDRFRRGVALLVSEDEGGGLLARPDPGLALLGAVLEKDLSPATPLNERFAEHLGRLGQAHARYPAADASTGLDARGETFVRLGPPVGHKEIDVYSPELLRRIRKLERSTRNGFRASASEFPDAELWLYNDPEPFSYLFVDDSGTYRVGTTVDLIPQRFRVGVDGSTGRGGARADILLEVLRTIFRQLSPYVVEYGVQFNEVDAYLGQLEALETRVAVKQATRPNASPRGPRRLDLTAVYAANQNDATGIRASPDYVVREVISETRRVDAAETARRDDVAPAERSSQYRPPTPLDARVARFLNLQTGDTQVLAYWPAPPGGGTSRARAVTLDPGRTVVADAFLGDGPRRLAWEGGTEGFGLAVQVERAGETLVARLPPATPLLTGATLEMSDLVPFLVDDVMDAGASLREGLGRDRVDPYPGQSLAGLPGVGLYAEVYLPVGGAEVFVTYTVETRREGGLFRRSDVSESAQQFYRETGSRVLPVAFLIDRAAWDDADEVQLGITVEVLETGETMRRSIRFETE